MKEYEVIIDLGSKTFRIQAENEEEAHNKAIKQFEELPIDEKIDEYWVGECEEVEEEWIKEQLYNKKIWLSKTDLECLIEGEEITVGYIDIEVN